MTTLDQANELAWLILAVERFGSIGHCQVGGACLEKAGLIEAKGHGDYVLTPEGQKWANRINRARGAPERARP